MLDIEGVSPHPLFRVINHPHVPIERGARSFPLQKRRASGALVLRGTSLLKVPSYETDSGGGSRQIRWIPFQGVHLRLTLPGSLPAESILERRVENDAAG